MGGDEKNEPEVEAPLGARIRGRLRSWAGNAVTVMVSLVFVGYLAHEMPLVGAHVANVPLSLGSKATVEVPLEGGRRLMLGLSCDSYRYKRENYVLVDAELLRGSQVVGRLEGCRSWDLTEAPGGWGTSHSSWNSDCVLRVPEGGATGLRVGARLEYPGELTTEKLSVLAFLHRL